ncbi:MAG TPA: hypothetical protein VMX35_14310 [Acidobacteriota bacterium]|nr:hypothetical protein [Acidobacteriota bacterium]
MDELLRKLAVEGWWAWVILLAVVTIAYLARHRSGLAALARVWEMWESEEALRPFLADGEEVRMVEGPIAITNKRMIVRDRRRGFAYAEGALGSVCNLEYGETHSLWPVVFGILYIALGVFAMASASGVLGMLIVGALIVVIGIVISLIPLTGKRAALVVTFSSGRPIVITGKIEEARLQEISRAVSEGRSAG